MEHLYEWYINVRDDNASEVSSSLDYSKIEGSSEDVITAIARDIAILLKGCFVYADNMNTLNYRWPSKRGFAKYDNIITAATNNSKNLMSAKLQVVVENFYPRVSEVSLYQLVSGNALLVKPRAEDKKWVKQTSLLNRISMIMSEGQIAIDDRVAHEQEETRLAAAEEARKEAARAERRERKNQIKQEEEALAKALEDGDQETVDRIADTRAKRYAQDMETALEQARHQHAEAVAQIDSDNSSSELLDGIDKMSFIYGWLAANVDYLYAKLPGWDYHAEHSFLSRFPNTTKTDKAGEPGYSITPADRRTSGGYKWQLSNEYHVHFKRAAIQKAPDFVIEYLRGFRSFKTGTSTAIKGDTANNAMAQYFIFDLGFNFGLTSESDAERTLRNLASDKKAFKLGYDWSNGSTALSVEDQADIAPFKQTYPDPDTTTASDYDTQIA